MIGAALPIPPKPGCIHRHNGASFTGEVRIEPGPLAIGIAVVLVIAANDTTPSIVWCAGLHL
ncbi:hypothetical protein MLPF_2543 [Mycobacterium lepromatosis]|nr:hypothetical protein MLPF_2543 [Mycobacterium lepromatosis]